MLFGPGKAPFQRRKFMVFQQHGSIWPGLPAAEFGIIKRGRQGNLASDFLLVNLSIL
jgi:hypothetical protein